MLLSSESALDAARSALTLSSDQTRYREHTTHTPHTPHTQHTATHKNTQQHTQHTNKNTHTKHKHTQRHEHPHTQTHRKHTNTQTETRTVSMAVRLSQTQAGVERLDTHSLHHKEGAGCVLYSQQPLPVESLLGSTVSHTSALSLSSCATTSAHLILLGGPHLLLKMRPPTQLTTSPILPAECGFVNGSAAFRSPATLCTTMRLPRTTSTCLVLPTPFLDEIDWAVDESTHISTRSSTPKAHATA